MIEPVVNFSIPLKNLPNLMHRPLHEVLNLGSDFLARQEPQATDQPTTEDDLSLMRDLSLDDVVALHGHLSNKTYREGLRLLAQRSGVVSWAEMKAIGIRAPGHWKSRTTLQARRHLGLKKPEMVVGYSKVVVPGAPVSWAFKVSDKTLAALKAFYKV